MSSAARLVTKTQDSSEAALTTERPSLTKLWIYTNYDCNLSCTYCVAESGPRTPRRVLDLETVQRVVDEAVALDFSHLYLTGGEPFLLDDIYDMLAYASARAQTTVLTNGMLFNSKWPEPMPQLKSKAKMMKRAMPSA